MTHPDAEEIAASARHLLGDPDTVGPFIASHASLETLLPITAPDNHAVSWFAPAVIDDRIVGFFVISMDGVLQRWSSFQRHRDTAVTDCPLAADWLDETVILGRARALVNTTRSAQLMLSYDTVPDRIAWRVAFDDHTIFVAGTVAWISPR
ncbi:MAG: hypothetical protein ACRCSP_09680 [Rhodoglobus sp.]